MSNINQWVKPIMDNTVSKMKQYGSIIILKMQRLFFVCVFVSLEGGVRSSLNCKTKYVVLEPVMLNSFLVKLKEISTFVRET